MKDEHPGSGQASTAGRREATKWLPLWRWLLGAAILLSTGLGLFLALGAFNQPDLGWPDEMQLAECRANLDGIRALLREQKTRDGTYPTTDEGLAALTTFQARFPVVCTVEDAFWPQTERWVTSCGPGEAEQVPWVLIHEPRRRDGEPGENPTSAPDLFRVARDVWAGERGLDYLRVGPFKPRRVRLDLAFAAGGTAYLVSPAGILSPSLVPYGYENRLGRPDADFAGSPVQSDSGRRYSLLVDDRIYLYSADGELIAADLDRQRSNAVRTRWAGGGLLVLAAALVVLALRRRRFVATALTAGIAALLGLGARNVLVSCYKPAVGFGGHRLAAARQRELADEYHRSGVFTDATYKLVLEVLALESSPEPGKTGSDSPPSAAPPGRSD
jgi:hypothetical protein